ncbi:MAG TPA: tRNA lysidine(34) synthetase TilS [Phycisphaerales bacterium]|nr:tRNA lysidine(34) synthetase TilS [Phycisphaerales bacterium]
MHRYHRGVSVTKPSDAPGDDRWRATVRGTPGAPGAPRARRIAERWRRLTLGGGPTLVACSGGADSSALALALGAFARGVSLVHVVHDLRPEPEALADRDAARALAHRLGMHFAERRVCVRGDPGNAEANARRARYEALADAAREVGARFVATGHHADDQLETVLMALIRGSGPRGLRGIAPRRALAAGVTLVRPMLWTTRSEAEAICTRAGVPWVTDRTNLETDRLRAALRAGPLREIVRLRPGAALAASRAADLQRDAARMIDDAARELFGEGSDWPRATLRRQPAVVLGAGLRRAARRLLESRGADRLSRAVVDPVVRAVRDGSTEPRCFDWPGGVRVEVTAHGVRMRRVAPGETENESPG